MNLDAEVLRCSFLVSQRFPFRCRNMPELSPTLNIPYDSPQKLFSPIIAPLVSSHVEWKPSITSLSCERTIAQALLRRKHRL